MAAQMNGKPKKSKKNVPNGHANGSLMSGHVVRGPKPFQRRRRSLMAQVLSVGIRLLIWYTIITAVFRCPSSPLELSEDSPKLCRPYLSVRSRVAPYAQPYYDSYLAPQVDKVAPYIDRFNQKVYIPAAAYYRAYGAPRVADVQAYALKEWERTLRPHIELARARAKAQYETHLSPHITKAYTAVEPHYADAKSNALRTYNSVVFPAYQRTLPYVRKGYAQGHHVAMDIAFPYLLQAEASTISFLQRTIWPRLRILYGDNVEPQLMRIIERLGRYKDSKKLEAAVDVSDSPSTISSLESRIGSSISTMLTSATTAPTASSETASAAPAKNYNATEVRDKVKDDLRTWQEKFARAADKGSEDLEERVKEITKHQIESQAAGVGEALLVQLEETVKSSIDSLKSKIKDIVRQLPDSPTEDDYDAAHRQAISVVREAGIAIKGKAQELRSWKQKYSHETFSLVKGATDSTLEVIDNIRDLGLQEIGMRWAWMDGVTYKDWAKYHELKKTFDEWRAEVEAVAMEHDGLKKAQEEGDKVEDRGMDIAGSAAKELARLKNVAAWKIHAHDATDDFSDKIVPAKAAHAAQNAMREASSAKDSVHSAASEGSKTLEDAASTVSSALAGTKVGSIESAATDVSQAVLGRETPAIESVKSAVSDKTKSISSKVSESIVGTEPSFGERAATKASEALVGSQAATDSIISAAKKKMDQASQAIRGTPAPVHESIASEASSSVVSIASAASEALPDTQAEENVKKVWGGAVAQKVKSRNIIYDHDDIADGSNSGSYSEKLHDAVNHAGDRAADVTRAIIDALLRPTSTQGAFESATSAASDRYERALSAASSVLYGTTPGTAESIASAASDRYAQAVTAASYAIYGTPTPVLQSLVTRASSNYDDALKRAHEQYTRAKSSLSAQISGTPRPAHEKVLETLESSYSSASSAAGKQYQAASASIMSLAYGPSQGPLESISSIASSKLAEGLSLASAQYSRATSVVGAEPTPAHQQYLLDARKRYYEAIGMLHEQYSEFVGSASSLVHGTPTPAYESLMSQASSSIIGTSTPAYESIASAAQSRYNSAIASASANLQSALSSVSSKFSSEPSSSADGYYAQASSAYSSAISAASSSIFSASAGASSVASDNWSSLVSRASEQVYGRPTPWTEAVLTQAGGYGAQATSAAAAQYAAVSALISDLVVGREPDFTESVMSRLSSAYYTGAPAVASSASSLASDAYASASSVVSSVFTPPATLEAILVSASEQINAAVEAASVKAYGTSKGTLEQASSAAASAYSSASRRASEAVYGTQPSYIEAAQSSFADVTSSAQSAISVAIYGRPAGTFEAATSSAASVYSSASSVASENLASASSAASSGYAAATKAASSAIYGPEQGALESASSRLAAAVESARIRLREMGADASAGAGEAAKKAQDSVESLASTVSSAAAKMTEKVKDEL